MPYLYQRRTGERTITARGVQVHMSAEHSQQAVRGLSAHEATAGIGWKRRTVRSTVRVQQEFFKNLGYACRNGPAPERQSSVYRYT